VHDTVDLEARGLPSVYIATVEFEDGGAHQARALGADPAAIFVEHPIQDRTDDEMREIADGAVDRIVSALESDSG
jgi:hypothetical protein